MNQTLAGDGWGDWAALGAWLQEALVQMGFGEVQLEVLSKPS